ncbi:MAG TPA: hypothetical protein VH560_17070 [Polyangia bacterium]|nr:hypothetical protein [Polyangia bacterium]
MAVVMALGTCVVVLSACDSRTLGLPHPDGGSAGASPTGTGTGGQTGGSQGQAGATTGSAGAGDAGAVGGSAGATGGAAGGEIGPCACDAVLCAPGYVATADPASCCPVCKPIVCNGACVVPTCGPNTHLEKAAGQCCATCMPGLDDSACATGRQRYLALRAELVDKYTEGGCTSDDDCALFTESNQCAHNCGTVVNAALVMTATSNLDAEATSDCGTCPPTNVEPPCLFQVALCSNGKCVPGTPAPR